MARTHACTHARTYAGEVVKKEREKDKEKDKSPEEAKKEKGPRAYSNREVHTYTCTCVRAFMQTCAHAQPVILHRQVLYSH